MSLANRPKRIEQINTRRSEGYVCDFVHSLYKNSEVIS
jgi:hypothetical protein